MPKLTLNGYCIVGFVHGRKVSDLHEKFHELLQTTFILPTRERFVKLIGSHLSKLVTGGCSEKWTKWTLSALLRSKISMNIIILGRLGKWLPMYVLALAEIGTSSNSGHELASHPGHFSLQPRGLGTRLVMNYLQVMTQNIPCLSSYPDCLVWEWS